MTRATLTQLDWIRTAARTWRAELMEATRAAASNVAGRLGWSGDSVTLVETVAAFADGTHRTRVTIKRRESDDTPLVLVIESKRTLNRYAMRIGDKPWRDPSSAEFIDEAAEYLLFATIRDVGLIPQNILDMHGTPEKWEAIPDDGLPKGLLEFIQARLKADESDTSRSEGEGTMTQEAFDIYVESYGKVRSGKVLDQYDYGVLKNARFREHDSNGKLAVSMAVQDLKDGKPMRTRSEFDTEFKRLQS